MRRRVRERRHARSRRVEDDPALLRVEPVLVDERGEQRVVAEAAPEARRADHLLGAVRARARRGTGLRAPRARAARPSSRPRGYDGRGELAQERGPLGRRRGVEGGEPALREERPRHVQRPPQRLAPPHRRRRPRPAASAFSHSVAAAMPAPTTATRRGVLVRLVGVDDARVALELGRDRRDPGGPARAGRGGRGRGRRARSRRRPRGRARSARARKLSSQRLAPRAARRRGGGTRRRSAGSGRRRSRRAARASRRRAASRAASPGNVVGKQWPSLSERMRSLPDRRRAPAPGRGRVGARRRRPRSRRARARRGAASRRRRSRRARRRRSRTARPSAYLTEPASSPWTK